MTGIKEVDDKLAEFGDAFAKAFFLRLSSFQLRLAPSVMTENEVIFFLAGYVEGWNAFYYEDKP